MTALTIQTGLKNAKLKAENSTAAYRLAKRTYGHDINRYAGDAPKSMALGHLLNVNPTLVSAPPLTTNQRRGFLYATRAMAQKAGVKWNDLDVPKTCAYIWGRDINDTSKTLYVANSTLFPTPNADFWRCAYLKHILGTTTFNTIWASRDKTVDTVYDGLLYAVNLITKRIPGWSVISLKRTVFTGCAYVFEMAKRGGSVTTTGFGIEPVLEKVALQQVFK